MKIRFGFVSNSSSSSFTCDVCGNTESGMDACASDLGFEQCVNGHCFCQDHQDGLPDSSPEQLRKEIEQIIKDKSWRDDDWKKEKLQELTDTADEDLEELFDENYNDDGCSPCNCPLCMLQDVSDSDMLKYLYKKLGTNYEGILAEIQSKFGSYSDFDNYIDPPKEKE